MAVLPLVLHPDPLLARVSAPVTVFDAALERLISDMLDTMYAAPGRGLAAVQVGVLSRVFVMDATWKDGEKTPLVFVNPQIVDHGLELITHQESCLSIPNTPRSVARPARVGFRWQGVDGSFIEQEFTGFEAACTQHEFDHLEGRTILDHEAPQ